MKIKLLIFVLSIALISACGGNKKSSENTEKSVTVQSENTQKSASVHPGKKVYDSVCLACHMADGSGVPGMHPPILESEFVNGSPEKLIDIVLNGVKGKLEVNGEVYNGIMPPQANLSDQQIADVLTYIRSNFGNDSGAITPEQVKNVRNAK